MSGQFAYAVRLFAGVPPASLFAGRQGTPIVINTLTDTPYYLNPAGVPTPFAGGGGGGVTAVTGTLGRITSSGGATPQIDLATVPSVTPGTYPAATVTVDAYGRVIGILTNASIIVSFVLGANPYVETSVVALPYSSPSPPWTLVNYI